jgi:hypothetical protein
MKGFAPLLLALAMVAAGTEVYRPPTEEPGVSEEPESRFRTALCVNTTLAVGDWKAHPVDGERTMFGPLAGVELETSWCLGRVFLGVAGRMCVYDTGDVVGLGEGSGRIEAAHAMSLSALASAGLYLAAGDLRPWVGLGIGAEWMIADETINGVVFDFDNVFPAALTFSPAVGFEYALSPILYLPLKVSYDISLNQVEGYGTCYGHGQDLVVSIGLGLSL